MPSIRPVRVLAWSCAAALAGMVGALLGCSSGGATTPSQPVADDAWVRATITLLDELPPCIPGVACAPEVYDCSGNVPISVPMSWTVEATSATAGMASYNPYDEVPNPPPAPPTQIPANGTIAITATDLVHDTALSFEVNLVLDASGGVATAVIVTSGSGASGNFVNTSASCTELNSSNDAVTLFAITSSAAPSVTITSLDAAGPDIEFAQPTAGGFSPAGIIEGRFSFDASNFQQVVQIYSGTVHVEGCFRMHVPRFEQGVPVVAPPAACP